MKIEKGCCFVGHHDVKRTPELEKRLTLLTEKMIKKGVTNFLVDCEPGWAEICMDVVFELREKYPDICPRIIMACPIQEQIEKVRRRRQKRLEELIYKYMSIAVILTNDKLSDYAKCRKEMLRQCDCCVCYYEKNHRSDSTERFLERACERRFTIINLADNNRKKQRQKIKKSP